MKFIHCADLHLASKLESRFSAEQAQKRRNELFETFRRLADEATVQGVTAILLCGDIFDEGKPRLSAKKRFLEIVTQHPKVDFLCLAGNHDESLSEEEHLPENLLCFDDSIKHYTYGNVTIYGTELSKANCSLFYSAVTTGEKQLNIMMLHGQIKDSSSSPDEESILLPLLSNKNIDYLALGHLHSYKQGRLGNRGVWCYSGCLEGRGYDECGIKGYVLLETDEQKITHSFVPFAFRTIHDVSCDLSNLEGLYEMENKILATLTHIPPKDLIHLQLTGSLPAEIPIPCTELEEFLKKHFFHAEVKNRVKLLINPEDYKDQLSLKGEFIRTVTEEHDLSPEDKAFIIRCGLSALQNEEVNFL